MSVPIDLSGKVAIITGAGSGIGRETAGLLSRAGASVVVADINLEGAQETVRSIEAAGGSALPVKVDIQDPAQAKAAVDATIERFGRVDI
ncbi:MAG: SDR family NAD(P)-dependent oxidoreductase, partial [Desulfobacterales bacterium]|nr:SDR family NAD(P)-dependent oxidoreductase [Desulfobacterales bacterium]